MKKLFTFLLCCLGSLPLVAQQKPAEDYTFYVGTHRMVLNPEVATFKTAATAENTFQGKQYVLLQFWQLPAEKQKQKLQQLGVVFGDYLPPYAYYATVPSNFSAFAALTANQVRAVAPLQAAHKYNAALLATLPTNQKTLFYATIAPNLNPADVQTYYAQRNVVCKKVYSELATVALEATKEQINDLVAPFVRYLRPAQTPQLLNLHYGKHNSRSGTINKGTRNLTGKGVSIGSWDGSPSGEHIDFTARYQYGEPTDNYASWHGTHTTGTMAGAGNLDPYTEGMAPEANIVGYTLTTGEYIPYEMLRAVQDYNITITQNSYGWYPDCPQGAMYDIEDRGRDQLTTLYPNLLHVFAIGNSQSRCSGFGTTAGNAGKNTITVGAVEANDNLTNFSSWGPTRDGRVKPDVTAVGAYNVYSTQPANNYGGPGFNGTSFACPVVSGMSAQLYQAYKQLNGNQNPRASLIKAVICNGATDLGNANVDYKFGFGRANAYNAVTAIEGNRYKVETIAQGQSKIYNLTVPAGVAQMKVLLAWTDPAAPATAGKTLINDLHLEVFDGNTTTYYPWKLNPASPNSLAIRGIDSLNNIEQVTINTPAAGNYQLIVRGASIATYTQEFSLTWQVEQPKVKLTFPIGGESLRSTLDYPIYWDAVGTTSTSKVEFSLDNGSTWQLIEDNIPTTRNQSYWLIPDGTFTHQALVRVSNGALSSTSELNFSLIDAPTITAATPSNQSINLTWTASTGATSYDILSLNLQTGNWELVATTNALTHNLTNLVNNKLYWLAVRAMTTQITGQRSGAASATPTGAGSTIDLEVTTLVAPAANACTRTATENITCTIKNSGTATLLAGTVLPVAYQINLQAVVNENFTLTADLAAGATTNYTFATTANLATIGNYSIKTSVNLATDLVLGNNTKTTSIDNLAPPLPVIVGNPNLCGGSTTLTAKMPIQVYNTGTIAFAPQNMTAATPLTLLNDAVSAALPLGFSFEFFGKSYQNLFVSSNGVVGFTSFGLEYSPSTLPIPSSVALPNNFIALALCDLAPNVGGTVKYLQTGVAPNRKFVVEYNNVPIVDYTPPALPTNFVTVQVILNENNTIEIHTTNSPASSLTKIMGLENETGKAGIAVSGRNGTAWAATNEGLQFTPVLPPISWLPNGETTPSITTSTAGTYSVSYTQNGCTYSQSLNVSNGCVLPTITSFTPTSGGVDVTVTIKGTNFTGITGISIGGKPARTFTVVNDSTVLATTNDDFATGTLVVTNPSGSFDTNSNANPNKTFTRLPCANPVSALTIADEPDSNGFAGIRLNWTNDNSNPTATLLVVFKPANIPFWTARFLAGTATTFRIGHVEGNIPYQIYIQSFCGGSLLGNRAEATTFTPTIGANKTCQTPVTTSLTLNGGNRAVFRWQSVTNAVMYQVMYQSCDINGSVALGSGVQTYLAAIDTSWTVTGLTAWQYYRFRVKTVCMSNNSINTPFGAFSIIQAQAPSGIAPQPPKGEFDVILSEAPFGGWGAAIYPNPAHEQVSISYQSGTSNKFSVVITDLLGREVLRTAEFENEMTLSLKDFAKGMYLVKITSKEGEILTQKLVVE